MRGGGNSSASRALLNNPILLLWDQAMSGLDAKFEIELLRSLVRSAARAIELRAHGLVAVS